MGFLDKAKKLAEQAQTKLDEVQGQFNERQQADAKPAAEPEPAAAAEPAAEAPPAAPPAPPAPGIPAVEEDRNHPSYAPPKLTGGDPLAG